MEDETKTKKADYSINWLVFWVLLILTAGEYYLGIASEGGAGAFMIVFALIKAGFIVVNYMNSGRLLRPPEDH